MSWINLLPFAFKLLEFGLRIYGASEETQKKFLELIESSYKDGLVPVKQRDKFLSQRERILARLKEKEGQQNP